jgi:hypothetical protein
MVACVLSNSLMIWIACVELLLVAEKKQKQHQDNTEYKGMYGEIELLYGTNYLVVKNNLNNKNDTRIMKV